MSAPNTNRGGPPANPLVVKLCELCEDGDWHELEPILREIGKLVPPGKAIRRAESIRQSVANAPAERHQPKPPERLIQYGRRSWARDALGASRRYFEQKEDADGTRWIRMRELPPRVARDRARARAHAHFDPVELADELRAGAVASALLGELSQPQLLRVAVELASRERARAQHAG